MTKPVAVIVLIFSAALTCAAALVHGHWTNRWGTPDELSHAGAVIANFPKELGPWHVVSKEELPLNVRGILQCNDYLQAVYENRDTGEQVMLTLLAGPPGPMAVHTPEICYTSVDSALIAPRQKVLLPSEPEPNSFWMVQFREQHEAQLGITRIYYSWCDDKNWNAVDEPRISFGGHSYLFKVQLRVQLPPGSETEAQDSARAFLLEFLPAFTRAKAPEQSAKAS